MISIVPLQASEADEVADFLSRFPGEVRPVEFWRRRFRCWWDDNPSFDEGCPRAWVIRDDEGALGGFIGNVPSRFQVDFEERKVFGGTTFRVLPEHRGASIRLYLAQVRGLETSILFNTTANAPVEKVLAYLGFRWMPSHRTGRTFLLPTKAGAAMRAYLRDRLGWAPDALVGLPLGIASLPLRVALRRHGGGGQALTQAADPFDRLWGRTRRMFANTSVRSAVQLQWFCFSNSAAPKTLIGYYVGGELTGYAVFADAKWRGVPVLDLVDLWTEGDRHRIAAALLYEAWRIARAREVAVVALYDYGAGDADVFRSLGAFFVAPDSRKHHYRMPESEDRALSPGRTLLSGLEGDRFL